MSDSMFSGWRMEILEVSEERLESRRRLNADEEARKIRYEITKKKLDEASRIWLLELPVGEVDMMFLPPDNEKPC